MTPQEVRNILDQMDYDVDAMLRDAGLTAGQENQLLDVMPGLKDEVDTYLASGNVVTPGASVQPGAKYGITGYTVDGDGNKVAQYGYINPAPEAPKATVDELGNPLLVKSENYESEGWTKQHNVYNNGYTEDKTLGPAEGYEIVNGKPQKKVEVGTPITPYQQAQLDLENKKFEADQAAGQQNDWQKLLELYLGEQDKLQALKETPSSWIEYSQKAKQSQNNPWWGELESTMPQGNTYDQALLAQARQRAQGLTPTDVEPVSGLPKNPDWLAGMSGGQAQAGQPISNWFKMPSRQTWTNLNPIQQQMFQGFTNWGGRQWQDVASQMNKVTPKWSSPRARFAAAVQR